MLGVPKASKPTFISRLAGMPIVHKAIKTLRLQQVAASALGVVPLRRKLKNSGCEYRVRHLESLLMADEIFSRKIYSEAFEELDVNTFIDLGANVGYFTLYVAEHTGRRDLVGLAVDANTLCTSEVSWHVGHNQLSHTKVMTGVAGYPPGVTTATFYVNPSNVASSAQPELNPDVPSKGESAAVTMPAIDVAAEWKKISGGKRVDLLKVDVEGFECDLIRNSTELLSLTDRLVLEWHKWVTSLDEVEALLEARGFKRRTIISEDPHCGVAIFDRLPGS
jgi:FkbM family methyltransferase